MGSPRPSPGPLTLDGAVAVVTGATSGVGFHTARVLAAAGARVLLGARTAARGDAARDTIRAGVLGGRVEVLAADLSDLDEVRAAAGALHERTDRVDILVNNAGVMAPPTPRVSAQGYELQAAVNHLAHFALTGLVLDLLLAAPAGRVVTVSSIRHRRGAIDPARFGEVTPYSPWGAYSASKLANLLFAFELERRFRAADASAISLGAHPGYARTSLHGRDRRRLSLVALAPRVFAQSAARGAQPIVVAAAARDVRGGDYLGPAGPFELWGRPAPARVAPAVRDEALAAALWARSVALTGVDFAALAR